MLGVTAPSASDGAARGVQADGKADANGYFVDTLLRSGPASQESNGNSVRGEVGRIFANALQQGTMSADDQSYLDRLVMARTGLNQLDADKRVSDVFARAKQTAEAVRKASARALLWAFVALLIGAFCASFAATIGGAQRDDVAGA
jgi:hypothetical protein